MEIIAEIPPARIWKTLNDELTQQMRIVFLEVLKEVNNNEENFFGTFKKESDNIYTAVNIKTGEK